MNLAFVRGLSEQPGISARTVQRIPYVGYDHNRSIQNREFVQNLRNSSAFKLLCIPSAEALVSSEGWEENPEGGLSGGDGTGGSEVSLGVIDRAVLPKERKPTSSDALELFSLSLITKSEMPALLSQATPSPYYANSGHRFLAKPAIAEKELENFFSTFDVIGILLTGLAEGADQLVAEIALDAGWQVHAILPMPLAEYEKDFTDPTALAQFRALLARCHHIIEISLASAVDRDIHAISTPRDGVFREQQYRNLGRYLVEHAQTMLLLWDGDASAPKPGGTAEVKLMCDAALARRDDPDWHGVRQIIHIPVERAK